MRFAGVPGRTWAHQSRELLLTFERFVETRDKFEELEGATRRAEEAARSAEDVAVIMTAHDDRGKYETGIICSAAGRSFTDIDWSGRYQDEAAEGDFARELAAGAELMRDIFGNPFRTVTVDPRWLTETVVALATGIYEERSFDRMPILADALEEAGCDHSDILSHCRGDGPHVRGCWVVDLILGKQ